MTENASSPLKRDGSLVVAIAAILGALGVVAGALGAHALEGQVAEARLGAFETGVRFHMYHALALLGIGVMMRRGDGRRFRAVAVTFVIGIILFSGSLYALVLTDTPQLGAVTPFGGVALITGWVLLAWNALRN
jgi:uncharacterized membrane protein YgdD (TMEM256/DUF423 family)